MVFETCNTLANDHDTIYSLKIVFIDSLLWRFQLAMVFVANVRSQHPNPVLSRDLSVTM